MGNDLGPKMVELFEILLQEDPGKEGQNEILHSNYRKAMCNLEHKALTLLKMRQPVPMSVAVGSRVCERMAKKGMWNAQREENESKKKAHGGKPEKRGKRREKKR